MKKVMAILKRDMKRILTNEAALLVLVGISLLPSLYAWFNIAANMDPYGNLDHVKVAVSNEDSSVPFQGKDLNAGDEIVEQLKKNDQLGWTFVDTEAAIEGVKAGDYYAAIVIPSDFSSSFLSILDEGAIRFPALDYYVNEKLNAIAPKITSTGLGALEAQIDSRFVAMSSEILGEKLAESTTDFRDEAEEKRDDAVHSLDKVGQNLAEYETVLKNMDDEMNRLSDLSRGARSDVKALKAAVRKGEITLDEASTLLEETRRESEKIAGAYENIMDDMNRMARMADTYSEKKYVSLGRDFSYEKQRIERGLVDMELINGINGRILRDLDSLSPIPKEARPLDTVERWRQINRRNGTLLNAMREQNEELKSARTSLEVSHRAIQNRLKESSDRRGDLGKDFRSTISPMMNQSFDLMNQVEGHFSATLSTMPALLDGFDRLLGDMEAMTGEAHKTVENSLVSLGRAQDSISSLQKDLGQLARGPVYEKIREATTVDEHTFTTFMESPVKIHEHVVYQSENYGSAMTPFFTNLALWVGGMILISIIKIDVDRDEYPGPLRFKEAYFGRWALFVLIGLVQALIVSTGDLWLLKAQCAHPFLFVLTALLSSVAYVSMIYSLAATFRNIGKAVAVIVLILQIPGASGTYPIEMMAPFFRSIYPALPFHYGIDAMREAMLGVYQFHLGKYWLILLAYLPLSLLIGLVGPRVFGSLNHIFDLKLAESELIHGDLPEKQSIMSGALIPMILAQDSQGLERVKDKHERFFAGYKKKKYYAFAALALVPGIFLCLLLRVDAKIRYLVIWVVSIIAFATYSIWLEYYRHRYEEEEEWMALSKSEVLDRLKGKDTHE
ncbi:MAG: YhgE/Pip domain-containing protein [Peptoniphilus sp.]|nr:YhgE/Pip domain-containing protein [Peptoniphilus sp.]MDY3117948.1 YhgE/Pip domain-containing protein [Peptoniphilus sp.]